MLCRSSSPLLRPGFFGAVYYGILGPKWMEAQGKTIEQCKAENAGKSTAVKVTPFVLSFIAELVMASALSGIMFHIGILHDRRRHIFRRHVLARFRPDHGCGQ